MRNLVLILLLLVAFPATSVFGQDSLTTQFNNIGGNSSAFFDIENISSEPITIISWDNNYTQCDGLPVDISLYIRNGTSQGFETTPVGWNLVGTQTDAPCNAVNTPSPFDIGGFVIAPGETVGVAITMETVGAAFIAFTFGQGVQQVYSNGELEITAGSSMGGNPFTPSAVSSPNVWNGTVFYRSRTNVPTLSQWGLISMAGIIGIVGFIVLRKRQVTA